MREDLPVFYGLISERSLRECVQRVCNVLGRGKYGCAVDMLLETAAIETNSGHRRERSLRPKGIGIFQMPRIAFIDVKENVADVDIYSVEQKFGFDIRAVAYDQLANSPLIAAVFCRLFYMIKPERFPESIIARAGYWKEHYATATDHATTIHYVNAVEQWKV
jgi:hypothetical protein